MTIDRLLRCHISNDTSQADKVLASLAILILLGLLVRLGKVKVETDELKRLLTAWGSNMDPSRDILSGQFVLPNSPISP